MWSANALTESDFCSSTQPSHVHSQVKCISYPFHTESKFQTECSFVSHHILFKNDCWLLCPQTPHTRLAGYHHILGRLYLLFYSSYFRRHRLSIQQRIRDHSLESNKRSTYRLHLGHHLSPNANITAQIVSYQLMKHKGNWHSIVCDHYGYWLPCDEFCYTTFLLSRVPLDYWLIHYALFIASLSFSLHIVPHGAESSVRLPHSYNTFYSSMVDSHPYFVTVVSVHPGRWRLGGWCTTSAFSLRYDFHFDTQWRLDTQATLLHAIVHFWHCPGNSRPVRYWYVTPLLFSPANAGLSSEVKIDGSTSEGHRHRAY